MKNKQENLENYCKFCKTLEPYVGVYRNNFFLGADLFDQMENFPAKNSIGNVLKCPECGDYYYYQTDNIPTRSEKALKAKLFQTFYKLSAFQLLLTLYPNVKPQQADYIYLYSDELFDEALRFLRNEPGPQNANPVSRNSEGFYENIAQIIVNLFLRPEICNIESIIKLVGLFKLKNETVNKIISEALFNYFNRILNIENENENVESNLKKIEHIYPKNSDLKHLAEKLRANYYKNESQIDIENGNTEKVKLTFKQKMQVISQMKENARVISAPDKQNSLGENVSYSFNKKIKRFVKTQNNNSSSGSNNQIVITQAEMIEVISLFSIRKLINEGFEI